MEKKEESLLSLQAAAVDRAKTATFVESIIVTAGVRPKTREVLGEKLTQKEEAIILGGPGSLMLHYR